MKRKLVGGFLASTALPRQPTAVGSNAAVDHNGDYCQPTAKAKPKPTARHLEQVDVQVAVDSL
eukprot:443201-Amphidinium_carterae.1